MRQSTRHAFISGTVQGVFYRKSTQAKATELGVTGWVKNVPDGRVELLATGETDKITALLEWCWQGSPASNVTHIEQSPAPFEPFLTFEVRY